MGFAQRWIGLIMFCVSSVQYSMLVNEKQVGPVTPKKGLGQGDPLSTYLFIICAEGLSALIRKVVATSSMHGVKVCRGAPNVSHLLFAGDYFLFFRAYVEECNVMKGILTIYESAFGQAINFQKSSIFFSTNVATDLRDTLMGILGVSSPLDTRKYLGLLSLIGKRKKTYF